MRSPRKILTKISAFEACSSDLILIEARPWRGSRAEPRKILTKIIAFEACSSNLIEARPWRGSDREAEPRKIFSKLQCSIQFSAIEY